MKGAAKEDKREQLLPEKQVTQTKRSRKSTTGPESLRSSTEPYKRVRLELPESMNEQIDRYFFENKKKGKNEFMVEAIRRHLKTIL